MADEAYNHESAVDVRYRDIDLMGWAHNSVLLVYVEEAKIQYFRDVLGVNMEDLDGAIARQEIDYKNPVNYGEVVTVRFRVAELGNSSMTTQFELETNGDIAARGEVVHVFLDEMNNPQQIPAEWADKIRAFESISVD